MGGGRRCVVLRIVIEAESLPLEARIARDAALEALDQHTLEVIMSAFSLYASRGKSTMPLVQRELIQYRRARRHASRPLLGYY